MVSKQFETFLMKINEAILYMEFNYSEYYTLKYLSLVTMHKMPYTHTFGFIVFTHQIHIKQSTTCGGLFKNDME